MQLTATETITYKSTPETSEQGTTITEQPERAPKLPKLFWAGVATFAANIAVAIGIWVGPELRVDMYGHETVANKPVNETWRPSPFTPQVGAVRKTKVRAPERVIPTAYTQMPLSEQLGSSIYELNLPRATAAVTPSTTSRQTPIVNND